VTAAALRPRLTSPAWKQSRFPALLAGAGLMALGVGLAVRLPAGDPVSAGMFAGIGLVAVWMFSTARYELTLAVVMLYLGLADGYLKLKTGSDVATLGRDFLLYAIVAGALVRWAIRGEGMERPPLTGWAIAWVAVVLVQVFNPANGALGHSISAIRPHIEFVPLFFLGYVMLQSKRRLKGFLMLLLLVAAVNGIVGLIQFNLSPEQLSNWGPGYENKISGTGDVGARGFADDDGELRTRPFALGSDMGFGGIVGLLAIPAALGLLAVGGAGTRFATTVLSAGVVMAVVTSQARVAIIGAVVAALAYAALSVTSRGAFRAVMALSLAVLVTYGSVSLLTSNSDDGAFDRYSDIAPNQALSTAYDYRRDTLALIPEYIRDYPLGAGIGSKGPAASREGKGTGGVGLNAESEPTFLLIEVGLPGLLVLLGLHLKLVGVSFRRVRRLEDPQLRLLVAAVAAPLVALFATWIVGVSTATTPSAPYLWFAAGVLSYWLLGRRPETAPLLDQAPPEPLAAPPPVPSPASDPVKPAQSVAAVSEPEAPVVKQTRWQELPKRVKELRRTLGRALRSRLG
jgi:hypothetical protein